MLATERQNHVPVGLVFGPVKSRRFGKSFGISLSYPGQRSCQWDCPYCQLGHLPKNKQGNWASVETIRGVLDAANPGDADVICCSGAGENLDHPHFVECLDVMSRFAKRFQKPLYILTNGDALLRPEIATALQVSDVCMYIKWDCGPRDGMWRSMDESQRTERRALLRSFPQVKIQSMFIQRSGETEMDFERSALRWLDEVTSIRPTEVHMTTIDRPCADTNCTPVSAEVLQQRCELVRRRLGVPVTVFVNGD